MKNAYDHDQDGSPNQDVMTTEISTGRLVSLLNEILDHQIGNRGTERAFYRCYTYNHGEMPAWVAKAERMVRLQRADEIVGKVWSHMCGYDLDGKQRNPLDETVACMRNWQKLHDIVAEYVLQPNDKMSRCEPEAARGSHEKGSK